MINKKSIGILYIVLSAFCFACMSLFVRLSGDLPSIQKSFFRNLIAFIFAVSIIWKNRVPVRIPKDSILSLILRSAAGTIGIFCNFYAVDHLPVADASMLNKLSPFFVVIFSYLILKEKVKWYQSLCILIAFIGSLFVTKPALFDTIIASIVSSDDISTAAKREKNNTLAPDSVTIRS